MIYIPIWLDLLYLAAGDSASSQVYLHSNMVRFIINKSKNTIIKNIGFTFQYGQIYYQND